jgi:hypothetical protein
MGRQGHGHYCWVCARHRANERFSGRSHARHVCKDCSTLGKAELACRQHIRNIDSMVDHGSGKVFPRQRASFERIYRPHANERGRRRAEQILRGMVAGREEDDACGVRWLEDVDPDAIDHLADEIPLSDQPPPWLVLPET